MNIKIIVLKLFLMTLVCTSSLWTITEESIRAYRASKGGVLGLMAEGLLILYRAGKKIWIFHDFHKPPPNYLLNLQTKAFKKSTKCFSFWEVFFNSPEMKNILSKMIYKDDFMHVLFSFSIVRKKTDDTIELFYTDKGWRGKLYSHSASSNRASESIPTPNFQRAEPSIITAFLTSTNELSFPKRTEIPEHNAVPPNNESGSSSSYSCPTYSDSYPQLRVRRDEKGRGILEGRFWKGKK